MTMRNRQVAELFSRGETEATGSHMYIDGDVVYSYGSHFPIARRIRSKVVSYLFNPAGYSNSTARHKSYVRGAIWGSYVEVENCELGNVPKQYHESLAEISQLQGNRKRSKQELIAEVEGQNKLLLALAVEKGMILEAV